jgi:hypothetical protein
MPLERSFTDRLGASRTTRTEQAVKVLRLRDLADSDQMSAF